MQISREGVIQSYTDMLSTLEKYKIYKNSVVGVNSTIKLDAYTKEPRDQKKTDVTITREGVIQSYTDMLSVLKKYKIDGDSVVGDNSTIKLDAYTKEPSEQKETIVGITKIFSAAVIEMFNNMGITKDTLRWFNFTENYAKSTLGSVIYKNALDKYKDDKNPNLFVAITTFNDNQLNKCIDEFIKNIPEDSSITTNDIKDSLLLVLMNAIRYYYVHALLAEIIKNKGLCTNNNKEGFPCIVTTAGSSDCTSDYDVVLYMYDGRVADVATEFYERVKADWGIESGDLFDTNIYTSAYLFPYNIVDKPTCKKVYNTINEVPQITDKEKTGSVSAKSDTNTNPICSSYIKFDCENSKTQLAYALIHLIISTPVKRIEEMLNLFRSRFATLFGEYDDLLKRVTDIINEMYYDAENIYDIKKRLEFKTTIDVENKDIDLKIILYKKYTKELYYNVRNHTGNDKHRNCDLVARINMCEPETYYSYGAFVMGVIIGQMHINVIKNDTPINVFVCAILEDYAFVMDKYQAYNNENKKDDIVNAKYVGNCAKYAYRILNSMCMIHECEKKININLVSVAENIINKNVSKIPLLTDATDIFKLKQLKTTPSDEKLINLYKDILTKYGLEKNNNSMFENFILIIDKIITNTYVVSTSQSGGDLLHLRRKHKNNYFQLLSKK